MNLRDKIEKLQREIDELKKEAEVTKVGKLFRVNVSGDVYVCATDKEDAKRVAIERACDDWEYLDFVPIELTKLSQVGKNALESIPWSDEDVDIKDSSVREILLRRKKNVTKKR